MAPEPDGEAAIALAPVTPTRAEHEPGRHEAPPVHSPSSSAKTLDEVASLSVHSLSQAATRSQAVAETASVYSVYRSATPSYTEEGVDEDSPYPEVRSAVSNVDDPSLPVSTIRAWTLGILWAVFLPGVNQFFHFRYPSLLISGLIAVLLSYPVGRCWARLVPDYQIFGVSLNPGDFTIKEHVLITVMGGVASNFAYATDIIAVQRTTYQEDPPFLYQWLLVMSTQLWGYSIGGIAQGCLVDPASMVWPNVLVMCALFNTLHSATYTGIGVREGQKRTRLFTAAFVGAGVWAVFPSYLFTGLSWFTWACWIAPGNVRLNQVFGQRSGMGLSILTFDWNQIAYFGSPLATPWWAEANIFAAFIFCYWFLTPVLYSVNLWHAQFMPMFSHYLYDNTGERYNVSRILDGHARLNTTAYHAYSPPFLATSFAVSYGVAFASVSATLTHALLYFRKPISAHLRQKYTEPPDVHARLMSVYAPVPRWWYAVIFVVCFVFAVLCIEVWATEMTLWALVIALAIALVYVLPVGMIAATTNFEVPLNVITEFIIGYALPGRPVAMMMFKTWGYIGVNQAIAYTSDFKLGHYMKIPPRTMFWAQIVATVVAGTCQLGIQSWMFDNIQGICETNQNFTCAGTQTFASASIFWGVIGPGSLFSSGRIYHGLLYGFLVGALAPLGVYLLHRRWPNSVLGYVHVPLMLSGIGALPPAMPYNFVPWALVGFVFQHLIRQRRYLWWAKYNYVLSAALDAGTAVATVLIYFCLQYPQSGQLGANTIQKWWGNTVYTRTADWNMTTLRSVASGTTFGPKDW